MATGPSTDQTPYLIGLEPNVSFVSLITAGDSVLQTDGGGLYQFGGIPDGLGAFDNGDGTVTVLVNHEFGQTKGAIHDHGSAGAYVDALIIDKTTLEVVSGDNLAQQVYLWDPSTDSYAAGTTAWERLCSGDLASPSAFYDAASGLGTTARIYLTGEETSPPFTTNYGRAFGFVASGADAGSVYELNMLGDMSFENQVACAYSGAKTVVLETDDATPGQVYVYVGDKQATGNDIEKAGLTNGQLYGIKVAGLTVEDAVNTVPGGFASFSLESMGDISDDNGTHLEINADAAGVTEFFRPEDISWDPTNPNYAYFVTTGNISAPSRLYRLEFTDVTNPTLGGNINLMFEGPASSAPSPDGPKMMDNIVVTADGHVIIQEDAGNNARLGKVWDYDPATDTMTAIAQHDAARFATPTAPFSQDEEASGVIDVTDIFGDATHQAFLVDSQAHYPVADPSVVEGGQLMLMLVETPHDGNKFDNAVNGSYGADTLTGKAGDDTILGGSNDDVLKGANGADSIDGGAGNDKLNGGDGTDTIKGGAGQDFLTGGAGADVFVFSVLEASAPALADRIGDLSDSDVIDLSGIDANSLVAGDQAFTLVGSFSGGVAGQAVLNYDADSNVTQLILDVNGDTIADMFIAIRGDHSDFANFVL